MLQKLFITDDLLIFLFIKVSWKNLFNCYNKNNKKCFLNSKSVYQNDFWRSCDTEDWSNDAENVAYIKGIHFIL